MKQKFIWLSEGILRNRYFMTTGQVLCLMNQGIIKQIADNPRGFVILTSDGVTRLKEIKRTMMSNRATPQQAVGIEYRLR